MGHHPVYSDGPHEDHPVLVRDWDPLFRQYKWIFIWLAMTMTYSTWSSRGIQRPTSLRRRWRRLVRSKDRSLATRTLCTEGLWLQSSVRFAQTDDTSPSRSRRERATCIYQNSARQNRHRNLMDSSSIQ